MLILIEMAKDEFEDFEDAGDDEKAYVPKPREEGDAGKPVVDEPVVEEPEVDELPESREEAVEKAPDSAAAKAPVEEKPEPEKKKEKVKYDIAKAMEPAEKVDESHLIKTIVVVSDWEEAIQNIIEEENIDPWNVDIVRLVDAFMNYLRNLTKFDFRVPARFIYVAAILLRLKCEALVVKELKQKEEKPSELDINVPLLDMPIMRVPKRKVTITDLIGALNKAIEFEERKKEKKMRVRKNVENLIVPVEDIEVRIKRVYDQIFERKHAKFSELVARWDRPAIVEKFIPVLHLSNSGVITCEQNELFGEIFITLKEGEDAADKDETVKEERVEEVAEDAKKEEEDTGLVEEQVSEEEMKNNELELCRTVQAPDKNN